MGETSVLVTGACGEIGQALVKSLWDRGGYKIYTTDLLPIPEEIMGMVFEHIQGDLVFLIKQFYDFDLDIIFHLAASLSSKAEVATEMAHRINVEGTMQLLMMAGYRSKKYHKPIKFIFPSSIAVYGFSSIEEKSTAGAVREDDFNFPHTMYGCNKLYCEKLGLYYSHYYGQHHLDPEPPEMVDFRSIRFPGLISAFTVPSGGTSDYGPEMLHSAARGISYSCFVNENTIIPFMAMPDAIRSILELTDAPKEKLTRTVYNVRGFSLSAAGFEQWAVSTFPNVSVSFEPVAGRQGIVDSWPEDVDDAQANLDWGWKAEYDENRFFKDYFLPEIKRKYQT